MAVHLLFCGVLPPGLVQYCSQHSCVVSVKLYIIYIKNSYLKLELLTKDYYY